MIRLYTFLIFVAIVTIVLFTVLALSRPNFVEQTSLLVLPENTETSVNLDSTINNIVYISENAVQNNEDVDKYNGEIEIERMEEHDILNVFVYGKSANDVKALEKSVFAGVVRDIKKFYTINEDISIKIIDKTEVEKTPLAMKTPYVIMVAVAVGLIAGVLIFFAKYDGKKEEEREIDAASIFAHYNNAPKQTTEETEDVENDNDVIEDEMSVTINDAPEEKEFEKKEDVGVVEIEKEEESKEVEKEIIMSDVIEKNQNFKKDNVEADTSFDNVVTPEGLPTTPGNLPIVDVSDFGGGDKEVVNEFTQEDVEIGKTEPTEEELKARLNELLNGKL
ncbi:MAG: hypothetical protein ABFQ53_02215 [Patescibacteria group bacterium]